MHGHSARWEVIRWSKRHEISLISAFPQLILEVAARAADLGSEALDGGSCGTR